jgi:hypothetical protein
MTEPQNRIMIHGPKRRRVQDGRRTVARDLDPARRNGRAQALPDAYALRARGAGYEVELTAADGPS